jgi:hypothetical protein
MKTLKQSDLKQVRYQVNSGVAYRVDSKVLDQVRAQVVAQVSDKLVLIDRMWDITNNVSGKFH